MKIRKVKTSSLLIGIVVELIFAIILGVTGGAIGLGSLYPQLNLVTKPFVCPGSQMSYEQNVSQVGSANYWTVSWFCVDEESGVQTELNPDTVVRYASPFYSLVFLAIFFTITYVYWNSSIGPAKNDGLYLW